MQIWEQALISARPDRRILVYNSRVVPFKQFISPLLLVNYESRKCAKAFYNVKLDIYTVPPVSQDQVEDLDKQTHWNRIEGIERCENGKIQSYTDQYVDSIFEQRRVDSGFYERGWDTSEEDCMEFIRIDRDQRLYTVDLEEHWSEFVRDKLCDLGSSSVSQAETSGQTKGAFYISPEHDVFITDYDCGVHFCIDSASNILGEGFPRLRGPACHHISTELSAGTRQRVSTLVLVRISPSSGNSKHCAFASEKILHFDKDLDTLNSWNWKHDTVWRKEIFPSVRAHFVL